MKRYSSQNTLITSKTKIVCTIGPASDSVQVLEQMSLSGMDVVRFNFSHDTHESHIKRFNNVKDVEKSTKRHISILCDIQGPKIRVGEMEKAIQVVKDQNILVTSEPIIGNEKRFHISYPNIHKDLHIGDKIYVNDGIVDMDVIEKRGTDLVCKIISGGTISSKKGCNLPSGNLSIDILSEKDKKDLELIAKLNPEFVAASFVGSGEDVIKVKKFLTQIGNPNIKVISKIERPIAVKNIDSIIKESDGIMVARGDLGVEIPLFDVPTVQKEIIKKANIEGKFSIVATQMLESMIINSRPTRAETNDVYNAVLDGTDAVMLSGETSVGVSPLQVVKTIDQIVNAAEKHIALRDPKLYASGRSEIVEAIGLSLYSLSDQFERFNWKGKFIIKSSSGYLARMVSKYRPNMPIVVLSENERTVREMTMLWGVRALLVDSKMMNEPQPFECINFVESEGLIDDSDTHVVVMGSLKSTFAQNLAIIDLKKVRELDSSTTISKF